MPRRAACVRRAIAPRWFERPPLRASHDGPADHTQAVRPSRRLLVAILITTAGLVAVPSAPARAAALTVSVTGQPVGRPIPGDFLGLALEYSTIPKWTAQPGQAANPILRTLVRGLDPTGAPSIRIGGQSTDRSWWPAPGLTRPLGVTYDLGPTWTRSARELVGATGARLLLGINLEAGSAQVARVEADELVKGVGAQHVQSLQLGNEPNLYRVTPWYRVAGGRRLPWYAKTGEPVYARPTSWDPEAYDAQFDHFARLLPHLPLAGPETNPGPWLLGFEPLLSAHSRVRTLTTHAYGLNNCDTDPMDPLYPSVDHLLSLTASRGLLDGIGPAVALAHHDGATLRVDEMGSVTCNGKPGVSDTFASALWGMDALFAAARAGVDGVNLHSFPDSDNGLFDFAYSPSARRWTAAIHPLYDGALMFAQAAPAGARLLHLSGGGTSQLRAWATRGTDHRVRILLINDASSGSMLVHVRAPDGYGQSIGTVERLQAPSASATADVTLGGERFSSTLTGNAPKPRLQSLHPHDGVETIGLPAASAALITLPQNVGATAQLRSLASLLLPVGVVDPRHLRAQLLTDGLDLVTRLLGAHP